jgi:hypothetical protein
VCPAGTFNAKQGSQQLLGQCDPCPAGLSCSNTGLSAPTAQCTAGYYCVLGTDQPALLCPFGYHTARSAAGSR